MHARKSLGRLEKPIDINMNFKDYSGENLESKVETFGEKLLSS